MTHPHEQQAETNQTPRSYLYRYRLLRPDGVGGEGGTYRTDAETVDKAEGELSSRFGARLEKVWAANPDE